MFQQTSIHTIKREYESVTGGRGWCWTLYWFRSLDRREALGVVVTRSGFLRREESSANPRFSCRWGLKVTAGGNSEEGREHLETALSIRGPTRYCNQTTGSRCVAVGEQIKCQLMSWQAPSSRGNRTVSVRPQVHHQPVHVSS